MSNKLEKKLILNGTIIAESGIMVGGTNSAFEIGGTDKQVIRNPINMLPYIPGSSLKGKLRSLLELSEGTISSGRQRSFGPTHNPKHIAAQLFGHIKHREDNNNESQQASRVIVRDGELINSEEFEGKTELLHTEVKAENSIDRITSAANPRFFERVPKGARFNLEIVINIFKEDRNADKYLETLFYAMNLAEDDYLGGSGSRGNGQIKFELHSLVEKDSEAYKTDSKGKDISELIPSHFKPSK
jgi:CRISPR-associated protein Csm3